MMFLRLQGMVGPLMELHWSIRMFSSTRQNYLLNRSKLNLCLPDWLWTHLHTSLKKAKILLHVWNRRISLILIENCKLWRLEEASKVRQCTREPLHLNKVKLPGSLCCPAEMGTAPQIHCTSAKILKVKIKKDSRGGKECKRGLEFLPPYFSRSAAGQYIIYF